MSQQRQQKEEEDHGNYREFISKLQNQNVNYPELHPELHSDYILQPTLTESMLEKSELKTVTFTHQAPDLKTQQTEDINMHAIKQVDIERLTLFSFDERHAEVYHKFSSYVNIVRDDVFYQKVLNYKRYFFSGQSLTVKLEFLKDESKRIPDKCWNLVTKQAQFDRECGDGRVLTCFTTVDSAVFVQSQADEIIKVDCQILDLTKELHLNEYLVSIARLDIQNYLDNFLQDFLNLLQGFSSLKDKLDGWSVFHKMGNLRLFMISFCIF